jgi:hypothetical protein
MLHPTVNVVPVLISRRARTVQKARTTQKTVGADL